MEVGGASKLVPTNITNNESKVESKGKGLGRTWTKIPNNVRGGVGKVIAAAKELLGIKHEISIGSPFNVVQRSQNFGFERTAAPEQKTLSEKKADLETSIKEAKDKLFDFEDKHRHKEKNSVYNEEHSKLDMEIANLNDQLVDLKEEIRRNS